MFLILLALGISIPHKNTLTARFSKRDGKYNSMKKLSIQNNTQNSIGCDMCTQIVNYIKQLFDDQVIESEIATIVEQLCTTFPSPYDTLCKTMVETYLPLVLQLLEKGLNASEICTQIGLCSASNNNIKYHIRKFHRPEHIDNGLACEMCTKIVSYIEQQINDSTIDIEIEKLVEQTCFTFPSPYDALCKTTVEQYLPKVIELIKQGLETSDICTKIALCSSKMERKTIYNKNKNKNAFGCDSCTKVVDYISSLLKDQELEEEIAALVDQLCSTFASPYDSLCKSATSQFLPSILEWLQQGIESLDICTRIGLCPTQSCNTCKSWFKWAEENLHDVTVEGLWKLVNEECTKVQYLKYFCEILNEQNIETFVSLILSGLPPEKCCEWIKVC